MCEISAVISPCVAVIAAISRELPRALGEADVEAHVAVAVGGVVVELAVHRPPRAREGVAVRARRRVAAASTATPTSSAMRAVADLAPLARAPHPRAPRSAAADRPRTSRRGAHASPVGGRSGRGRAAPGAASSARCRVCGRGRARPAGACRAASSPSLIAVPRRSTVSSNAVCERTGAKTASSLTGGAPVAAAASWRSPPVVCERSQPLEAPDALPVGDRQRQTPPARRRRRGRSARRHLLAEGLSRDL